MKLLKIISLMITLLISTSASIAQPFNHTDDEKEKGLYFSSVLYVYEVNGEEQACNIHHWMVNYHCPATTTFCSLTVGDELCYLAAQSNKGRLIARYRCNSVAEDITVPKGEQLTIICPRT